MAPKWCPNDDRNAHSTITHGNSDIHRSSWILRLIIALLCTSFSDLSEVTINKIALRRSPVFVPIVSRNCFDSSFPQITLKHEFS